VSYTVELRQVPACPIAVVRGYATSAHLSTRIRALFQEFYAGFQGKGGLNIVYYPTWDVAKPFEIECGVQVESGGNSSTPAGTVATTAYLGPYSQLSLGHDAIHQWVRANGHRLAGPSWEVYGHWTEDPAQLRTDIFYLLRR
jgi:effector-binding domain-containing protein